MNLGKTLFTQIMEFIPWTSFTHIVSRYGRDFKARSLSCTEQFRAMAFAQLTIAALYKSRWQVELFFKSIKQHLRIKRFIGASENAVKTQIWCAVATYLLIAIDKLGVTARCLTLHFVTDFVGVCFRENKAILCSCVH
jgi:IS4 transposase